MASGVMFILFCWQYWVSQGINSFCFKRGKFSIFNRSIGGDGFWEVVLVFLENFTIFL